MLNHRLFILSIFASFSCISYGQIITGTVLDKETKIPLAYANVGILGKNNGTVTDENGNFSLSIPEKLLGDTLRISYIGYESISLCKYYQDSLINLLVELKPKSFVLNEVIITPSDFKEVILGNTVDWDKISIYFLSEQLGSEVGTVIRLRKKALLQELRFNILKSEYDSLVFRINVYDFRKGLPQENLLKEPIVIRPNNTSGLAIIDIEKYNVWLERDFLISVEYFKQLGDNSKHAFMSGGIFNNPSYWRLGSQGKWTKVEAKGLDIGMGLHVKMKKMK